MLEPVPLEVSEDSVAFVAVMVKDGAGAAADAFGIENTAKNASNAATKRDVLQSFIAKSSLRSLLLVPRDWTGSKSWGWQGFEGIILQVLQFC